MSGLVLATFQATVVSSLGIPIRNIFYMSSSITDDSSSPQISRKSFKIFPVVTVKSESFFKINHKSPKKSSEILAQP